MKNTFIHIGYPKCASTALQLDFFSQHPELFYLGPYTGGMQFRWYNKDIKRLAEVELRLMKDFGYEREWARKLIKKCRQDFEVSNKKAFGFSFESLAFTMHHDIDVTQKAERLADIFGRETKIVIVIRNQFQLIKSLYREMIVAGLTSSFSKFMSDIFYNKFRSFLYDFNFHKMYNLYSDHFGAENVLVLPYEYLKADSALFLTTLSKHLDVNNHINGLQHKNESLNDAFYEHFRELNSLHRHSMGLSVTEPINQFRYSEYFSDVEQVPVPPNTQLEDNIHALLWTSAREISRNSARKTDFGMPDFIEKWLKDYYSKSNSALSHALNLPLKKLGYNVL